MELWCDLTKSLQTLVASYFSVANFYEVFGPFPSRTSLLRDPKANPDQDKRDAELAYWQSVATTWVGPIRDLKLYSAFKKRALPVGLLCASAALVTTKERHALMRDALSLTDQSPTARCWHCHVLTDVLQASYAPADVAKLIEWLLASIDTGCYLESCDFCRAAKNRTCLARVLAFALRHKCDEHVARYWHGFLRKEADYRSLYPKAWELLQDCMPEHASSQESEDNEACPDVRTLTCLCQSERDAIVKRLDQETW